ncbi:rhp54 [Scenedesmus sp. PABB004]|nr:rhp54 [Scenedesmus sp. PABB004]
MRRSMAPSAKRLRVEDGGGAGAGKENAAPPWAGGCALSGGVSCSTGVSLGGFLGVSQHSAPSSGTAKGEQQSADGAAAPPRALVPVQQFKCPIPGGGALAPRGTLGMRKNYRGITGDLLAAIQRKVYVREGGDASSEGTALELVLYDPEEHRLALRSLQDGAPDGAKPPPGSQGAPDAPPAPPALPPPDAGAAGVGGGAGGDAGGDGGGSQLAPAGEAGGAGDAAAQPVQPAAPAQPVLEFGIDWSQRVKVVADAFLVEKLRPHQREGVKFVFECLSGVRQGGVFGAVLADGMGLGKTFQTVASLHQLLTKGVDGRPTCRKPLILCPSSLVQNWGKELWHWLGDRVVPVVVDDTRPEPVKRAFQDFRAFAHGGKPKVLVLSYPTFRQHKAEVYRLNIDVVMCDEAHFLKNGEAQLTQAVSGLSARRRLLMSGTPIQNGPSLSPPRARVPPPPQVALGLERMGQLMRLCNKFMLRRTSTVLKSLLPAKVEQVVFCKLSPLQLRLYNAFLASRPVQALLASTAPDADGGGGGKGGKRKSAKAKPDAGAAAPACGAGGGEGGAGEGEGGAAAGGGPPGGAAAPLAKEDALAPLVAITALKKLCCHPDLIHDMLTKRRAAAAAAAQQGALLAALAAQRRASGRACASGARDYAAMAAGDSDGDGDGDDTGKGGKKKGGGKGAKKRGSGAGGARGQLNGFEGCEGLFGQADVYPAYQAGKCQAFHSGKVMVLQALLQAVRASEPTDKAVLVSNYTEALDVLQVMCDVNGWTTLRLDGSCSVKQRQALVDTFNDPAHPSFVLLLSSKAGGVGLNIVGANRLVLFDPDWNPANDLQAMARVWREGQKKRVWIYRLLTAGSIEEKVLQRQLAKQGLSEALVDEVGQEVRTFSRDELRSLFRVNPATRCETHAAIKCGCDGSAEAMASCAERAAAAAASSGAGGEAEQQGVMVWAHLTRAADSPDPTWQAMKDFARDNYVTYVFSDHVLDGAPAVPPGAARRGAKRRRADGDDGEEEDEEEEEEEEEAPEEEAVGGSDGDEGGDSGRQRQQQHQRLPAAAAPPPSAQPPAPAAAAAPPAPAAKPRPSGAAAKPPPAPSGRGGKAHGSGKARGSGKAAPPAAAKPAAKKKSGTAGAAAPAPAPAAGGGDALSLLAAVGGEIEDAADLMLLAADDSAGGGDDNDWFA